MSDFGWGGAVLLQFGPQDAPLIWYGAVFVLALLVIAAGIGFWMARTESERQPVIDHESLINAFEEPLVVVDHNNNVLIGNVPFRSLFKRDIDGRAIEDVLDSAPGAVEAITNREQTVVAIEGNGGTRQYEIRLYPAGKEPRPPRKWVVLFDDVTDQRQRETELEPETEQLDQFAGLISHDLRNPLDVAIGRTNAVTEQLDDTELSNHMTRVQEAHRRMQEIIDDMLSLARSGHSIDEIEQVPLETVAMDAWSLVETGESSLVVDTQLVIRADRERLTQIFENLFRNAVQHAGPNATVRVDALESGDGFVVADDGAGIPIERRTTVLEAGYTDGEDGTGLGLAIVSSLVDAHGWTITVSESDRGGAQFEFSGVETVANESPETATDRVTEQRG